MCTDEDAYGVWIPAGGCLPNVPLGGDEVQHGPVASSVRSLRMTFPDETELGAYLRMDGIPGEEGDVQGIKSSTTDNSLYRRLAK
ncbi:hypothetical protein DPEC_G00370500 [Dallia pectoralis]|nr:hypothetical protein DPEC_G00370500 [Dallia pectoralis]